MSDGKRSIDESDKEAFSNPVLFGNLLANRVVHFSVTVAVGKSTPV